MEHKSIYSNFVLDFVLDFRIRFRQILMDCLSWLKNKHIKRLLPKMWQWKNAHVKFFLFWLPNVKILDKRRVFFVKNKQNGKYVEKWFLVSKTLLQSLNKATCNSFLHNKGTKTLYTWVLKEVKIKCYTHYTCFSNC